MLGICYQRGSCITGDVHDYMQLKNSNTTSSVFGPSIWVLSSDMAQLLMEPSSIMLEYAERTLSANR